MLIAIIHKLIIQSSFSNLRHQIIPISEFLLQSDLAREKSFSATPIGIMQLQTRFAIFSLKFKRKSKTTQSIVKHILTGFNLMYYVAYVVSRPI